ncbi:MAG: EpsI family protein [Candidatus Omnitrophica bacterium]|nr:EpsI family protein [Candidatus Omnitrophota bacterium]
MHKSTIGYITIVVFLLIACFLSLNLFFRQRSDKDIVDIRVLPYTIRDWAGKDLEITENEYRILETRNLISREYVNPANKKIYLFIIYSETNRSVFHPPEVCLIGSGIAINDKKSADINYKGKTFLVNKLYLEKGDYKDIALYCYKAGNFYTGNYYLQQAYFAFNQLLGKCRGGATIRVSMPLLRSEEETLVTLKTFMKDTIEILEKLS